MVDYLTFGGIYRDVSLRMVDPCHIVDVFVQPQDVLTAPRLHCEIALSAFQPGLTLTGSLVDSEGGQVAQAQRRVLASRVAFDFPEPLAVALWTLDDPALYQFRLSLQTADRELDSTVVRCGFRQAEFAPDGAFYLNGQPLKIVGLNRHQTYPYIGAAAPRRLQIQDADILKNELGCNLVRASHYPQSPHFLDRCDEIGLLVFEEIPGWQHIGGEGWKDRVLEDLQAMIVRDRNHPAIILWGVRINESPDDHALYAATNQLAHQLDSTRQTGGVRDFQASEFLEDVFTYNDFSNGVREPVQIPYLITEFAGHMFPTKVWDNEERREAHALLHARIQDRQLGHPRIAGAIGWCAFDYGTHREFGSGDRICHHGVMDIFRLPKWAAYFYQSQQSPERGVVLQAATHWTMGDRSGGGNDPFVVFSNCDAIDVFIGEANMGRFRPDRASYPYLAHPPFTVKWSTEEIPWGHATNDLRLVGYIDGVAVAEQRINSRHLPHGLRLHADADCLYADGADMTRVTLQITDRFGNVLPYGLTAVEFSLEGQAALIGENPLPLVGGQAAVYVKAGHQAGTVTISARTPGLPPVSATIVLVQSA